MTVRHLARGKIPYNVNVIIAREDEPEFEGQVRDDGDGNFTLALIQPHCPERHTALGRFMDQWSKLEIALGILLRQVLRIEHRQLPALMNSLGIRGILDVVSAHLASNTTENCKEVGSKLLERVKEKNTQRNSLIHGFWMLEWNLVDQGGRPAAIPRVYRAYEPTDPEAAERLRDTRNKKDRLRYMFSIKRIEALVSANEDLTFEISAFSHQFYQNPAQ